MNKVTVQDIVNAVKMYRDEFLAHKDNKIAFLTFRVMHDISLKGGLPLKTKVLAVNKDNTVDIPSDYHSFKRLAMAKGNKLLALSQNNRLNLNLQLDSCGNTQSYEHDSDNDNDIHDLYCCDYNKPDGKGETVAGQLRIDFERNQFILSRVSAHYLVLEYYSSIPTGCIDFGYEVGNMNRDVIEKGVIMKLLDPSLNKAGTTDLAAFQIAEKSYKKALYELHVSRYPITIADIHDAMMRAYEVTVTGVNYF